MDCPNPPGNSMQYIDARDQATFVLDLIDSRTKGAFNCCLSPEITFGEMLECIARTVGPPDVTLNWIDLSEEAAELASASYPLWSGRSGSPVSTMDASAAIAKGLKFRPLEETIIDTLTWLEK